MPRTEFNSGAGDALACFWGLRLGFLRAQGDALLLQWGKGRASAPFPISQHVLLERSRGDQHGVSGFSGHNPCDHTPCSLQQMLPIRELPTPPSARTVKIDLFSKSIRLAFLSGAGSWQSCIYF